MMYFRVNILILVLSPYRAIEMGSVVWSKLKAQVEHNKNA